MCASYLQKLGYEQVETAGRDDGFDLKAHKNSEQFFFEVKYSSKKTGKFFGTVMLTELYKAILYQDNYYFLVCRGIENETVDNWFFKLIPAKDFLTNCTLTTPIFHYHLYLDEKGNIEREINFAENTVIATKELILEIWNSFQEWKNKR